MELICYLFSINGHVFEMNVAILSMTSLCDAEKDTTTEALLKPNINQHNV